VVNELLHLKCKECGFENIFNQPHMYHAGFSNQGFLYNESGNKTLIWSTFDSDYVSVVGNIHPWALTKDLIKKLENKLKVIDGEKWLFKNPARCLKCKKPISDSITNSIYYLIYDKSYNCDSQDAKALNFKDFIE
jgi:hypothetical protein